MPYARTPVLLIGFSGTYNNSIWLWQELIEGTMPVFFLLFTCYTLAQQVLGIDVALCMSIAAFLL